MSYWRERWEFARHIPPKKLLARARLSVKRKFRDRFGWILLGETGHRLRSELPLPLMPPRRGMISIEQDVATFTFLSRSENMPLGAIDWSAPSASPADQLWRMNLHYMEYLEEVDDHLFERLVLQWIHANDPPRPGAWRDGWNSYALSVRIVVWMQQFALRRARLSAECATALVRSLYRQVGFLRENLETDLGGNHLIKNIKALVWAGQFFADGDAWLQTGAKLAEREIVHQIMPDGMHEERSASYHAQVTVDFLEMLQTGLEDKAADAVKARMPEMLGALIETAHPDGLPVLFNDAGLHMSYRPADVVAAAEKLEFASTRTPTGPIELPDAGYFGFRNERCYVLADCGPIGPDDLPGHGHGDILSFVLSVGGRRFIVDQGVFRYFEGSERLASKTAANHNTLSLAGSDQAAFFGSFRCGRRPKPTVEEFERRDAGFQLSGSHDGYASAPHYAIHRRTFSLNEGTLVIVDDCPNLANVQAAAINFLLHPDVIATVEADGADHGMRLVLQRGDTTFNFECEGRATLEPAVWWPNMGVEIPTIRIRVSPSRFPHVARFDWEV